MRFLLLHRYQPCRLFTITLTSKIKKMKSVKLIALFVCGACFMSFTTAPVKNAMSIIAATPTSVKWKAESADLGKIPQGKPVTINFEFTNTGKDAVIITNVTAGCGCTVTDYPKEPIAAGKSAKVTATFNAAAAGDFSKKITVNIQNEDPKDLTFKGTVI